MTDPLPDTAPALEAVVPEQEFAEVLGGLAQEFVRISSAVLEKKERRWPKRFYFRLQAEADELEVALDDYGARYNRTYCVLTELTASVRGFALAGLSLTHLSKRLEGYGVLERLDAGEGALAQGALERSRQFVQDTLIRLLESWWEEARERNLALSTEVGRAEFSPESLRFRLPRNVGQAEIEDEEQRIAEVASKYLQACEMLEQSGLVEEGDPGARERLLGDHCDEQMARVFEATVHNLQSAYDTHIGHTLLEDVDDRLKHLRGHISTALHLLETVTQLTHFVERHDNEQRSELAEKHLSKVVGRHSVQEVILNDLFLWARRFLQAGVPLAEELLPRYTDLQSLDVLLPEGVTLHARPASLLVAIATHHGTPVEMSIGDQTANTSSILEVMVLVGSNPEAREFRFRGDAKPLLDIQRLFESGLGEQGLQKLPPELDYLRR